ncbi:hypothetical protein PQR67_11940 [Paraburkholderia fungorum]
MTAYALFVGIRVGRRAERHLERGRRAARRQHVTDDRPHRRETHVGIDHAEIRPVVIIGRDDRRFLRVAPQRNLEVTPEQYGKVLGALQGVTERGTHQHRVTEDAVARNMHGAADVETNARIAAGVQRVGKHDQFLSVRDEPGGLPQIAHANAASRQQHVRADPLPFQQGDSGGNRMQGRDALGRRRALRRRCIGHGRRSGWLDQPMIFDQISQKEISMS